MKTLQRKSGARWSKIMAALIFLFFFLTQGCVQVGGGNNVSAGIGASDTTAPTLTTVSITSNNLTPSLAKSGDLITLNITASEPISAPSVTMAGVPVAITTFSATSYSAELSVSSTSTNGNVVFLISGIIDQAGNTAPDVAATSDGSSVSIDTVAPLASSTPQLNSLDDSGVSSSDAITSQTTALTFSGSAEAGATVQLYDNSVATGFPVSAVSGSWSIDLALASGIHSIAARVTDAAGNTSIDSAILSVTIDTTAPTLTSVTIASSNANVTQVKTSDTITLSIIASQSITTPVITIAGRAATVTGSGTSYSASLLTNGTEANGTVAFNISGYSDLAGNAGGAVSAITAGSNVTFDNIAPSGYSVLINNTIINSINTYLAFNTSDLSSLGTGLMYALSISSSGGGNPLMFNGSVSSTVLSGGITVNSLGDGLLTLSLILTDAAGNVSSPVTATVQKNTAIPTILSAETMDTNSNGRIDYYKITFSRAVIDATFPGYVLNSNGSSQADWLVAGYSNAVLAHGTSAPVVDTLNDAVIYIKFTEGSLADTGAKPDLTTTAIPGITDLAGNPLAQIDTLSVVEQDTAKPIVISATGSGEIGVSILFSESVFAGTAEIIGNYNIVESTTLLPLTVTSSVMSGGAGVNGNKVVLTTSAQTFNTTYTITVNANVTDLATIANGVNPVANSGTFSGFTPIATAVAGAGQRQNTISWGAVTGATSYNVYWSTTPGVTTASPNVIAGATSPYLHSNLTPGITLYYIVTAVATAESNPSIEVSATPFLQPLKTGQTQCWNIIGNLTTCTGTGQDGEYQKGRVPNFTIPVASTFSSDGVNIDYTTTDNDTGLIWKTCSEGLSDPFCATGTATTMDWATATGVGTGCDALNSVNAGAGYAGIKSWHVPSNAEIETILDYSAWPTTFHVNFPGTLASPYWTSYEFISDPSNAGYIDFGSGWETVNFKIATYNVRCVSSSLNYFTPVFFDNGDGTISDKTTNLVWQKCSMGQNNDGTCSGGYPTAAILDNALNYCNGLTLAGRTWRLPNVNELKSIVDRTGNPSINMVMFPGTLGYGYMSSTSGWYVYFVDGGVGNSGGGTSFYVRCVTDGP